jgi:hypothetical protein
MEIYVLSDTQLASMADWQKAIDAEGFALVLSPARSFAALRGSLPIQVADTQTGFECDHWDPREILEGYSDAGFDHRWHYCLAFRWGADLKACLGAYMAAAAYAGVTKGVVLDCDQGKILQPTEAAQMARNIEAQLPMIEQAMRGVVEKFTPKPSK